MTARPAGAASEAGLGRVLALAARRLERNGLRPVGRMRLERITAAEVAALSGLLGARWRAVPPGAAASVGLDALDAGLRAAPGGASLVETAGRAAGAPLVDRSAARSAATGARERAWTRLVAHRAITRHPALAAWLERERRGGAASRAGDGAPCLLLEGALEVLAALPADPPESLARFAARHCGGDPHALDRGRPLDGAVSRALAHLDGEAPPAAGAEARRARYDRWGVGCDALTSTALCLGLRPQGDAPLARALTSAASQGQPRAVTLRELRGVEALRCGSVVFSCENPAVLAAAADELGAGCPPLICTAGWPSTAALRLLRAVVAGGAMVRLHGDMDREGLRILQRLLDVTHGCLWRMTVAEHARHAAAGERPARPAGADAVELVDPQLRELAVVVAGGGALVREELVLDDLLSDMRRAGPDLSRVGAASADPGTLRSRDRS